MLAKSDWHWTFAKARRSFFIERGRLQLGGPSLLDGKWRRTGGEKWRVFAVSCLLEKGRGVHIGCEKEGGVFWRKKKVGKKWGKFGEK
jgi:hypothetical protein